MQGPTLNRLQRTIKANPALVAVYTKWLAFKSRKTRTFAFVATTGRSGTNTLADMFDHQPGCIALHEPYPAMTTRTHEASPANGAAQIKIVNILRAAAGHALYLETNHLFIKNFAEPITDFFGDRLRVIHLVRDPISVATSFLSIGSIPGVTELGRKYLIDPRRQDNVLPIAETLDNDPHFQHHLFRCLWYWYETEARIERYRRNHPSVPVLTITTPDLNDPARIADLAEFLNVPVLADQLKARSGLRSNEKKDVKTTVVSRADAEIMHARLLAKLRTRFGHQLVGDPCPVD